jgi:hypothetical protein
VNRCCTSPTLSIDPRVSAAALSPRVMQIQSRFLEAIPGPVLDAVPSAASHRRLAAHSVVTNQEDPADYLLLTKAGARHFFTTLGGRKLLLLWLVPGDIFGGSTLSFQPSSYLVSTQKVKASSVLVWHRKVSQVAGECALIRCRPRTIRDQAVVADYLDPNASIDQPGSRRRPQSSGWRQRARSSRWDCW